MSDGITNIAGIEIPFADPAFLAVIGIHILLGLTCTVTGVVAIRSAEAGATGTKPGKRRPLLCAAALIYSRRLLGSGCGRIGLYRPNPGGTSQNRNALIFGLKTVANF